jgi:Zn finger protein HypA/HybF involved in hydrogenase expression
MKAATISELKQELQNTPPAKVTELCLRLARFKKENKELLTFLLFEADDIPAYIANVKLEMDTQFESINKSNVYFVKKTLRKILRITNKFIRYSGNADVETELLIYFCATVKSMGTTINNNQIIINIYKNQLKKIDKAIASMHEDLQYDYLKAVKQLH